MKKQNGVADVTSEPVNTTLDKKVVLKWNKEPLSLNLEFGREDLNENFRKIQEAINELKK